MGDPEDTGRKPPWLKVKTPPPRQYRATAALLDELELHTVCREARCPNAGECYGSATATFLILGDTCTRGCRYCSVNHIAAEAAEATSVGEAALRTPDPDEPRRLAEAARRLGLRHVVITSVTRDDLPDGGASHFAVAVAAVRDASPDATVEVLIPDLGGDDEALRVVLAARPEVLNHNLETVPRLYSEVRPQALYDRSLQVLARAAAWARDAGQPRPLVKSGLMVGFGERGDEVAAVLADCAAAGVDAITIGQYLQPERSCLPVTRYVTPEEFHGYERLGKALRMTVMAAPFARSSYRAGDLLDR